MKNAKILSQISHFIAPAYAAIIGLNTVAGAVKQVSEDNEKLSRDPESSALDRVWTSYTGILVGAVNGLFNGISAPLYIPGMINKTFKAGANAINIGSSGRERYELGETPAQQHARRTVLSQCDALATYSPTNFGLVGPSFADAAQDHVTAAREDCAALRDAFEQQKETMRSRRELYQFLKAQKQGLEKRVDPNYFGFRCYNRKDKKRSGTSNDVYYEAFGHEGYPSRRLTTDHGEVNSVLGNNQFTARSSRPVFSYRYSGSDSFESEGFMQAIADISPSITVEPQGAIIDHHSSFLALIERQRECEQSAKVQRAQHTIAAKKKGGTAADIEKVEGKFQTAIHDCTKGYRAGKS